MLYILDANVLIDAERDYYSFEVVPEFWTWLSHMCKSDKVKIPLEVYEEIISDRDKDKEGKILYPLSVWAKDPENKASLILDEEVDVDLVQKITQDGYAPDLSDIEVDKIGKDPFLIAYALKDVKNRILVTNEVSKPKRERANRHIPDVCNDFSIQNIHSIQFVKDLGFSTKWKSSLKASD